MTANDTQIGGNHYKKGGEEHWDRAWRLKYDPFQYIITKWIERWRDKGGLEDLKKARHAIDKYIELVEAELDDHPGNLDNLTLKDCQCGECGARWGEDHDGDCSYNIREPSL